MSLNEFRSRTSVIERNNNKSLPIGTIATVKDSIRKLNLDRYFDGLKTRGINLSPLVAALVSYRLTENFSIDGCGRWLSSSEIRNEIGIAGNVCGKTLNRAVKIIGRNMEEALPRLRDSVFSLYDAETADVNMDPTSVSVYGKQTSLFRFGYSRDKRPGLRQVNIGVAEIGEPFNIPIHAVVEKGNTNDPVTFLRMVNDLIDDVGDGSRFIFDAGGNSKNVTGAIIIAGKRYITRKKLNVSDDVMIKDFMEHEPELVDPKDGVYCKTRTFTSSGRTTYLFFSEKLHDDKMKSLDEKARRCVEDAKDKVKRRKDGTLRISNVVIKRIRNPLISLNVGFQSKLLSTDDDSYDFVHNALSNGREGFFKLESSENLTPSEVLRIYRKRDTAE